MGHTSVQLSSVNMANLRLLCVLIVLSAVCWEANCSHMKTIVGCGFVKYTLTCGHDQKIAAPPQVHYAWRTWFFKWWKPHWYSHHKCANGATGNTSVEPRRSPCLDIKKDASLGPDALRSSTRVFPMRSGGIQDRIVWNRRLLLEEDPAGGPASSPSSIITVINNTRQYCL